MLEPTEKAVQTAVIDHWKAFGVPGSLVAAIPNARAHGQPGLCKGLFDLLTLSPTKGVGFIELKTSRGRLSYEQRWFQMLCEKAGVPAVVCRGRDEPIAVLREWGVIR